MANVFIGDTANEVWSSAFDMMLATEAITHDSMGQEPTKELLHTFLTINNPLERYVTGRVPVMNPAFAIAEVIWIVTGRNDSAFVTWWNGQLRRFVGTDEKLHGAYGFRLRRHHNLDQLAQAYEILKTKPWQRQVVLQIWDARLDMPHTNGMPRNKDIPCNLLSMLKIRDGKLEWTQVLRSNDLFLGMPYNFVQYTFLQEIMAGWLGVGLGSYNQLSDSLHLYIRDADTIDYDSSKCNDRNTDLFLDTKEISESRFLLLAELADRLREPSLTWDELSSLSKNSTLSEPYRNLLCVLTAETARKRQWDDLSLELISSCTNPVLRNLWTNWRDRFHAS